MDNRKVAEELVKLAKELSGAYMPSGLVKQLYGIERDTGSAGKKVSTAIGVLSKLLQAPVDEDNFGKVSRAFKQALDEVGHAKMVFEDAGAALKDGLASIKNSLKKE